MPKNLCIRTANSYKSPSNRWKVVKTPGNRHVLQKMKKIGSKPRCAECKEKLNGLPCSRGKAYSYLPKCQRSISRAYGGMYCHKCLRDRIMRAFLQEEKKCVQAVLLEKKRLAKAAESKDKKKKSASRK